MQFIYCWEKACEEFYFVLDEFATKIHDLISNLDFRIREFEIEKNFLNGASVTLKKKYQDGLPARKSFLNSFGEKDLFGKNLNLP